MKSSDHVISISVFGNPILFYWFNIISGSPPIMTTVPTNQTVTGGVELFVPCVVEGKPIPEVTWVFSKSIAILFSSLRLSWLSQVHTAIQAHILRKY